MVFEVTRRGVSPVAQVFRNQPNQLEIPAKYSILGSAEWAVRAEVQPISSLE